MLNHEWFFSLLPIAYLLLCCIKWTKFLRQKRNIRVYTVHSIDSAFFRFSRYCSIQLNILAGGWCFRECVKVKYSMFIYFFVIVVSFIEIQIRFFFLLFIKTGKCSSNYFITSDAHIGFIWWLHIYVYVNWHLSHDIGFSLVAQ